MFNKIFLKHTIKSLLCPQMALWGGFFYVIRISFPPFFLLLLLFIIIVIIIIIISHHYWLPSLSHTFSLLLITVLIRGYYLYFWVEGIDGGGFGLPTVSHLECGVARATDIGFCGIASEFWKEMKRINIGDPLSIAYSQNQTYCLVQSWQDPQT